MCVCMQACIYASSVNCASHSFVFTNNMLNIVQVRVNKRLEKIQRLVTNVKNGTADEAVHAPGIL